MILDSGSISSSKRRDNSEEFHKTEGLPIQEGGVRKSLAKGTREILGEKLRVQVSGSSPLAELACFPSVGLAAGQEGSLLAPCPGGGCNGPLYLFRIIQKVSLFPQAFLAPILVGASFIIFTK